MINPFYDLYITEKISPSDYVGVVSPILIPYASKIFSTSNVAVLGTQGSGKTTLLSLLKHEIRVAYLKSNVDFPVDKSLANFISPGINIIKSGILDIGKRPISDRIESEEHLFPLYFADFFNYYICADLLRTINNIYSSDYNYIDINMSRKNLNKFISIIKNEDCWFGYLLHITNYNELYEKIFTRTSLYRNFHQFNINKLPDEIENSKTSIGEPISRLVRAIKESEIIPPTTNVFVRIDQLDSILGHDKFRSNLSENYRRMINAALVNRDPYISYKIGSRTYAWKSELRIYNSSEKLEEDRSYTLINVDEIFKRSENAPSAVFPRFAKDVFLRRLLHYNLIRNNDPGVFNKIFCRNNKSEDIAKMLCSNSNVTKALKIPEYFSPELQTLIEKIYSTSPLEGILAVAWLLQGRPKPHWQSFNISSYKQGNAPWDKKWWKKERIKLALMQLASNCNQLPIWGGANEIIELGKGGTICFLAICQQIWDVYLRTLPSTKLNIDPESYPKEGIDIPLQTLGIISASKQWVEKISELPSGYKNKFFVETLGRFLRNKLLEDQKMSYPGLTGFSLRNTEVALNREVSKFLNDATDYGVLFEYSHTSKEKNKFPRTKWYFNPIYYPYLRMYESRIKEPLYTKPYFIQKLLNEEDIEKLEKASTNKTSHIINQLSLFGE